jgi:hypothetical protein
MHAGSLHRVRMFKVRFTLAVNGGMTVIPEKRFLTWSQKSAWGSRESQQTVVKRRFLRNTSPR